ncbi:MAG: adenylate kinase [Bacteroidetes bacterium]|nr:adenylate kinase [Bacteroidota bacterium]
MRLLIFGPPGAGKGTQAQFISKYFDISHISTGDIFREHIRNETPLGIAAKRYSESGELVPDEVTNAMVRERLSQPDVADGFLLDGYPRTPSQASALEEMLPEGAQLDGVLNMIVPEEELLKRLSTRGRQDDELETIRRRLRIYHDTTEPLADYYRDKGLLLDIRGVGGIDDITKQIIDAVNGRS